MTIQDEYAGKHTGSKRWKLRHPLETKIMYFNEGLRKLERLERRKAYNKQWWKDHPEKSKEYHLPNGPKYKERMRQRDHEMSRYYEHRIRKEDFEALLVLQHHRCAICGNGFSNPLDCHIDHDHVGHKLRGLLCRRCNMTLGFFKDNPELLENAAKYLRGELSAIRQVHTNEESQV